MLRVEVDGDDAEQVAAADVVMWRSPALPVTFTPDPSNNLARPFVNTHLERRMKGVNDMGFISGHLLHNTLSVGMLALLHLGIAHAQAPHIDGSWALDAQASEYPGAMPRSQVRTYYPADDGYVIGIAITVDADGNASFLQYAAKTDGRDYPEYGVGSLAELQMSGRRTSSTYAETQLDEYTVEWVDKNEGQPYLMGTKNVSEDGQTLTIEVREPDKPDSAFTLVYTRQ